MHPAGESGIWQDMLAWFSVVGGALRPVRGGKGLLPLPGVVWAEIGIASLQSIQAV